MDTVQLALNGMPESECGSGHQFDPTTFMFKHSLSGGLDTCGTVVDYGSNGELIFRTVLKIKHRSDKKDETLLKPLKQYNPSDRPTIRTRN